MTKLRSNEYWGKRGTMKRRELPDGKVSFELWVKRGATGAKSNSGPTGRALRRKQRIGRVYSNPRSSRRATAPTLAKGRKTGLAGSRAA